MATASAIRAKIRPLSSYFSLAKPGGVLPHFITTMAAMCLASGGAPQLPVLWLTLLGGGCVAAAANTFNSYFDRDIDVLMERTRKRPLPSGRVTPVRSLFFGTSLGIAGMLILGIFVNPLSAALAVGALLYYIIPYTLWLKRRTFWSAIIGSGIGAIPPLIGWAAVTDKFTPAPFLISAIIMFWTLPHFWALAICRRSDYAQAGLEMLPARGAKPWILFCASLLVAATLILPPLGNLGFIYLVTASLLGIGFLGLALRMNEENISLAWNLYRYSILYIAILFGAMIIDKLAF
jgi:heme o synthase